MTKSQIKNYSEKMINELKEQYPIPNLFLGLNAKESKKHLQSLINEIKLKEYQLLSK